MKIMAAIGRFLSGMLAAASGFITLLCNNFSYDLYNSMPEQAKYMVIFFIIALGVFLIILAILDLVETIKNGRTKRKLKYQSKKFIDFFAKWYSREGNLSVICVDLDWIKTGNNDAIYLALIKKSTNRQLDLFLENGIDSELAQNLKQNGARLFEAPKSIVDNYTFSCLSVMGNSASRIIVRNKQNDDNGYVIFEEISNTYITGLLNVLLDRGKKE